MPQQPINDYVADWIDDGGGGDPAAFHQGSRKDDESWSPAVLTQATSRLNAWCRWLAGRGQPDPLEATATELRAYLRERKLAGRKSSTRHDDAKFIKAFYVWAALAPPAGGGLIAADPMAAVVTPKVDPTERTRRAARVDEVAAIEAYCTAIARNRRGGGERERGLRNAAIVSLMFGSGLRSGEIPVINLDDFSRTDSGTLYFRLRGVDVKNNTGRVVPVTAETEKYLKRYIRARGKAPGPLFLGRANHTRAADGRLSAKAVQQVISRAAKACGLPVSSHQLRSGWTAEAIAAGADVQALMLIGGWSDGRLPNSYIGDARDRVTLERFATLDAARRRRRDGRPDLHVVADEASDAIAAVWGTGS